jgi:hypothetical protein
MLCVSQGKNACLLVYGAPGTGKSFALEGNNSVGHGAGLVPRAVTAIFEHLCPVPSSQYLLQASLSGTPSHAT